MNLIRSLWLFFTVTIFQRKDESYKSGFIRWWVRQYKLVFYTARGLIDHGTMVRSAALTFYTLMSIVPVAALVFALVKGFGLTETLTQSIYSLFPQHREIVEYIVVFAEKAIANAQGGVVAFVGVILLFWTVVRVFGSIESAFNNIWEVKVSRSFVKKTTDYIAVVVITPVLWVVATTAGRYAGHLLGLDAYNELYNILSYGLSFLVIWAMFSFIYLVVPNTSVKFINAFKAGIVTGTIFLCFQYGYIELQRYMTSYNAIYGSFAALPLFLIWVQWSWQILLFGGELSFAYQNITRFTEERESLHVSYDYRRQVSLAVMLLVARLFRDGHGPVSAESIHTELRLPTRIVNDVLYSLVSAHLLVSVRSDVDDRELLFSPAVDIHSLTLYDVLEKLDRMGNSDIDFHDSPEMVLTGDLLGDLRKAARTAPSNVRLIDIPNV
jgi:membrane protein